MSSTLSSQLTPILSSKEAKADPSPKTPIPGYVFILIHSVYVLGLCIINSRMVLQPIFLLFCQH